MQSLIYRVLLIDGDKYAFHYMQQNKNQCLSFSLY